MDEKNRQTGQTKWKNAAIFGGKTLFYMMILVLLVYLYHYKQVGGGSFIYNEF